jgi:putative phosphonate metabolism protein
MDGYTRYAVYYAPPPGPLADFGAHWLGWDAEAGEERAHPAVRGLPRSLREITALPRKYGFHGTLKAPFRLAEGREVTGLHAALQALAGQLPRVRLEGLGLAPVGPFLALVPEGDSGPVDDLAARLVESLDGFRAPPDADELARRRVAGLSPRQEEMLTSWGYPYVMEEFLFHVTLTGPLPEGDVGAVAAALAPRLDPVLPRPFRIDEICLFGEGQDGWFRNLHRYPLSG